MAILESKLSAMSHAELVALAMAQQAAGQRKLSLKVSEKGAVSLYGMGRFPVTLYAGQWERVIENVDTIKAFIDANRASLATKA